MGNKVDLSLFEKAKRYSIEYVDVDSMVDKEFVKSLRNKLNMTQAVFASVLGLKKKTIEKWEQGKNPIKGGASRLLYVLDKRPYVLDDFYKVTKYESTLNCVFIQLDEKIQEYINSASNDWKFKNQEKIGKIKKNYYSEENEIGGREYA